MTKINDSLVQDATEKDIIIVVMGATGAGKSTFINTLVGKTVAEIGEGLRSKTTHVQHYVFPHPQFPKRRILVVDTPGFDDTTISDEEILRRISSWLAKSYRDGNKHAGLVYLHDISHRRVNGAKRMNYEVFEKICGEDGATKVVLATTMWGDIPTVAEERREKELKEDFWSNMYSKGSTIHRVRLTEESVLEIINSVLSHGFDRAVAVQREMVIEEKDFTNTEAFLHLQQLKRTHREVGEEQSDTGSINTDARQMPKKRGGKVRKFLGIRIGLSEKSKSS